jgi:thiol-disulfide isomerase/thioredoxin
MNSLNIYQNKNLKNNQNNYPENTKLDRDFKSLYLKYGSAESTSPSSNTYRDKYLKYDQTEGHDPKLDRDFKSLYLKYKQKYMNLKGLIQSGGSMDKVTLHLFKAEWCGHCRVFKKTWIDLQDKLGKDINFVTYDADDDKDKLQKYNVNQFPTLILQKNNKAVEFIGNNTFDEVVEFVNTYSKKL